MRPLAHLTGSLEIVNFKAEHIKPQWPYNVNIVFHKIRLFFSLERAGKKRKIEQRKNAKLSKEMLDKCGEGRYNITCALKAVLIRANAWVWRSLVACLNGVQEAGGSNPLTQTNENPQDIRSCGFFLHERRVHLRPILRRAQRRQGPAHAATGPLFLPLFRRRPHACSMESPPEADRPPAFYRKIL